MNITEIHDQSQKMRQLRLFIKSNDPVDKILGGKILSELGVTSKTAKPWAIEHSINARAVILFLKALHNPPVTPLDLNCRQCGKPIAASRDGLCCLCRYGKRPYGGGVGCAAREFDCVTAMKRPGRIHYGLCTMNPIEEN